MTHDSTENRGVWTVFVLSSGFSLRTLLVSKRISRDADGRVKDIELVTHPDSPNQVAELDASKVVLVYTERPAAGADPRSAQTADL